MDNYWLRAIDKNLILFVGSIRNDFLCVKNIITTVVSFDTKFPYKCFQLVILKFNNTKILWISRCNKCRARSPERADNCGLFGEQPLHIELDLANTDPMR